MKINDSIDLQKLGLPKLLKNLIVKNRNVNYQKIKIEMASALKQERKKRKEFEARLYERWKEGIDLLEAVLLLGRNLGSEFNTRIRPFAAKDNDFVFEVLTRIHARSCMILSAVISLLKSGHASDAIARARTLHELRVIASFIKDGGKELAESYLLYDAVESLRSAKLYDKHYKRLKLQPLDKGEIKYLEKIVAKYKEKYGNQKEVISGDYGWASVSFKGKRVTFSDIEKRVGMDHWHPYFRLASMPIHAGVKGVLFDIGYLEPDNLLFAGSSNAGLADPAMIASMAFQVITSLVLLHMRYSKNTDMLETYVKSIVGSMVLYDLVKETNNAFYKADAQQKNEMEYDKLRK